MFLAAEQHERDNAYHNVAAAVRAGAAPSRRTARDFSITQVAGLHHYVYHPAIEADVFPEFPRDGHFEDFLAGLGLSRKEEVGAAGDAVTVLRGFSCSPASDWTR